MIKEAVIVRKQHPSGIGMIYYVEGVDLDSNKTVLIKLWDSVEVPFDIIMETLAWHSRTERVGKHNLKLEFNRTGLQTRKMRFSRYI